MFGLVLFSLLVNLVLNCQVVGITKLIIMHFATTD